MKFADRDATRIIFKIVDRAYAEFTPADISKFWPERWHMMMDLSVCHANNCPLRLDELLGADRFNFSHDLYGIGSHMNRETGKLEGFFTPRFAVPVTRAA